MSHIREFEHLKIPLEAIKSATNNFAAENRIGKGGFGKVYKGEIVHSKGQSMVAFKRLDRAFGQGNPEFWKEIIMLSLYRHENLVHLIGFCDESDEKILIYEYASNRSLDMHLNSSDLTWTQRLKICIGVARGLAYLHNPVGNQVRVLHRDVKSSNILLDENWIAKIADFGLSKFANTNKYTFMITSVVGTPGYCDPLYMEKGFLTKESDVYSLGVVLFEVLCGRLCICKNDDSPLTELARQCYEKNKVNTIIFGNIRDEIHPNSLRDFTTIAYQCLKWNREERPSITDVVRMLGTALKHQDTEEIWELHDIVANKEMWEPHDIVESLHLDTVNSVHLKAPCLPDSGGAGKVMRLIYTNSGLSLLVLTSNATHWLWKWQQSERNPSGKTAYDFPQLDETKAAEESPACIALSKNDAYIVSASGGKVSLFNIESFKVLSTFMSPPPAATYLAFHRQDNNVIAAIGMEDSTIQIYDVSLDKLIMKLNGHQKQITGLAFSRFLNALVSSGADAQLCMWGWDSVGVWDLRTSRSIQSPPGYPSSLVGETKVQFRYDQRHLLVVHESQIAIYDHQLECLKLWFPRGSLSAAISSATYSCDGLLLFIGFLDGAVGIFDADILTLNCRIAPSAYISSSISSSNSTAYPAVIAAHPSNPKQFALGMSDGSVHVIGPHVFRLEQESAFYFNMKYFEEQVLAGEWDEVERYLCGFTKLDDNRYSFRIFFEIRKQKYLEALDRKDRAKAVEILVNDLKVFSTYKKEFFKELTQLLTLDNIRENEQLSKYGDTKSARSIMLVDLKKLIEANPLFREKLTFPVSTSDIDKSKPSVTNQLGPIPNVSSSMASGIERDRMQTPLSIGNLANAESSKLVDIKPRIVDSADKTTSWKLPEIVDSSHLKALRLPDPTAASKVMRLIYTNSGLSLLALASNAIHKLWKWQRSERNPSGKSTASIVPQLWQPTNGALMSNDVNENKPAEESAACIALSKNDSYVMSASGGKVSLFNMMTFKVMTTFMPPPPAATYLAFHPQDNNIIAIGMEDSTIQIYNVRVDEVKMKLKGHQKPITGLAFSQTLNALVSSGADAQLCIWNINGWEKRKSRSIQSPPGHPSSLVGETKVQFHNDQRHILVVHESQIAIYDHQLECLKLWSPRESLSAAISSAIYSCDGLLLFTGFSDGAVGVFDADTLRLRCRIAPSAYISSSISSSNSTAYPAVIAAHPSDPNQFALGMSDGSVHVIEPADADPKWGGSAPQENSTTLASSNPSNSALNSQPSETPSR